MSYFRDIRSGIRTTLKGLSLTLRHLRSATHRRTAEGIASDNYFDLQNGLVTLQYPHEQLPIPDNGRYRLRNEIDDCIVCDKCAKICPVDCITIDAIKATEEVGRASDGSPIRLYAAKFDIDMAKCCYCGLCTVVCPTECLTMDKKFDYSEFELGKLTYQFAELTPAQADQKRVLYEQFVREKEAAKAAQVTAKLAPTTSEPTETPTVTKRPVFRPTAKPAATSATVPTPPPDPTANSTDGAIAHPLTDATPDEMQQIAQGGLEKAKKPVFRPTQRSINPPTDVPELVRDKADSTTPGNQPNPAEEPTVAKPAGFRPTMKPPKPADTGAEPETPIPAATPEPTQSEPVVSRPKPAFRPTMKPVKGGELVNPAPAGDVTNAEVPPETPPKPKPAFRPTMRPRPDDGSAP